MAGKSTRRQPSATGGFSGRGSGSHGGRRPVVRSSQAPRLMTCGQRPRPLVANRRELRAEGAVEPSACARVPRVDTAFDIRAVERDETRRSYRRWSRRSDPHGAPTPVRYDAVAGSVFSAPTASSKASPAASCGRCCDTTSPTAASTSTTRRCVPTRHSTCPGSRTISRTASTSSGGSTSATHGAHRARPPPSRRRHRATSRRAVGNRGSGRLRAAFECAA
jgi:hypothetical protein